MPKGKNEKVIGLMKNEFCGQIMKKKIVGLRAKTYSCLKDQNEELKKQKSQKTMSWKQNLNFEIIKMFQSTSNWK